MHVRTLAAGMLSLIVRRNNGFFRRCRRMLSRSERLSRAELDSLQLLLLKRLIGRVYRSNAYYRRIMVERGIRPDDITVLKDIRLFPVLTKADVLAAGPALVSSGVAHLLMRKAHTGGTTGTPLTVYRDIPSIGREHAFVRRQFEWAGIGVSDPCAYLTGRVIAAPDPSGGKLYRYDPFMKEIILSSYHLCRDTARVYAEAVRKHRARALVAYPSTAYAFARYCRENGTDLQFESVLTSSEVITDSMKQTIEEVFQCRVYDFFGSAERVCYIHTCEQGSYHLLPEYGYTELVPVADSDQRLFRLVCTGFWNLAMPLIRYDTGDMVVLSGRNCSCGRNLTTVDSILGRESEVITSPSGRVFGSAILTHILYGAQNILESQIVQDAEDHLLIRYVPRNGFSERDRVHFRTLLRRHLPEEFRVSLQPVAGIERTKSGKFRPLISAIRH